MEQILRILKQLTGSAGALGTIPKPIKVSLTVFGAFVGVVVIFKYAKLDQSEKTFLIIAIVLLGLITAVYYAWKAWTQKQQNQQFGGEISQHSSATPRGLSDPGQRARLDDMRKKFQSGVEAYKSRGKDLYKLPWYVIVGEPGSGKTEAVRHSNVGFPPGMQDEFQGVGGTINMNWWFTNHAVLLDTAGRLMFEEVKPGETSEWREFLGLLKKNRPNCPINGLFLVIPSDSLIKDSADSIQKKAGTIAQQLDVIQRVLDVRFPVFVVVTKCDKINGFREFFDGLSDPQLQHQMMGWSNPDPLDEPFKPEMVDKHLDQVGGRLRRRRLGLLRDPVPENTEGRRTDEVDSLYAFPHSLELLSSRLRRYLETIFIAGEWSAKPLFLRGIYFSSSMREGAALDAELAEAIGVGVEDLPEGKIWERERAYFLRDLFLDKVFREKGLVTRASNTKRMLRTQQVALYGFGFAALALFCAVAWFAMGNLRNGVKDQGDYWHVVSTEGWENKLWKKSIVPVRGDGSFDSAISTNLVKVDNKFITLGEFHAKLRDLAEKRLEKSRMFPGLADNYNLNSRKAQRIVFEAGIIRPLLEASRQKMSRDDASPGSGQRQGDALAGLIQLESDILARGTSATNNGQITQEGARKFLAVYQDYIAGKEMPVDTNLVAVMAWTYSTNDAAKGSWPPARLSGSPRGTNTLAANVGINNGLAQFVRNATNGVTLLLTDWPQILSLRASVKTFADSEDALFTSAKAEDEQNFGRALNAVQAARSNLVEQIKKASAQPLFAGGVSLTNAQHHFQSNVTASAGAALARVRAVNEAAMARHPDSLFREIKERLDTVQSSVTEQLAVLLKGEEMKDFKALDESCLADNAFNKRADFYAAAEKLIAEKPFGREPLLGLMGKPLEKLTAERIEALATSSAAYAGARKSEFSAAMAYHLKRVVRAQSDSFFAAYLAEAQKKLGAETGFPLVGDLKRSITIDRFMAASKDLKYISDDLSSAIFKKYSVEERSPEWKKFISGIRVEQSVVKALMGEDGTLGLCSITMAASTDATHNKDAWRDDWFHTKLIFEGGTGEAIRNSMEGDQKIGDAPVQHPIELRLIRNANDPKSPVFPVKTEGWGPVWLIHKYKGERDKMDPKLWRVEFPAKDLGAASWVRLKLKFDGVLPELDKWPLQ